MYFLILLDPFLIKQSECPEHKVLAPGLDILNSPKCTKSVCCLLASVLAFTLHSLKVSQLNFCLQVLSQAIFSICTVLPLNPLHIFLRSQPQSLGRAALLQHGDGVALIRSYYSSY